MYERKDRLAHIDFNSVRVFLRSLILISMALSLASCWASSAALLKQEDETFPFAAGFYQEFENKNNNWTQTDNRFELSITGDGYMLRDTNDDSGEGKELITRPLDSGYFVLQRKESAASYYIVIAQKDGDRIIRYGPLGGAIKNTLRSNFGLPPDGDLETMFTFSTDDAELNGSVFLQAWTRYRNQLVPERMYRRQ